MTHDLPPDFDPDVYKKKENVSWWADMGPIVVALLALAVAFALAVLGLIVWQGIQGIVDVPSWVAPVTTATYAVAVSLAVVAWVVYVRRVKKGQ